MRLFWIYRNVPWKYVVTFALCWRDLKGSNDCVFHHILPEEFKSKSSKSSSSLRFCMVGYHRFPSDFPGTLRSTNRKFVSRSISKMLAQLAKKYIFQPMFDSWNVISNFHKTWRISLAMKHLSILPAQLQQDLQNLFIKVQVALKGWWICYLRLLGSWYSCMCLRKVIVSGEKFRSIIFKLVEHARGGSGVVKPCRKYLVALTFRRPADSW